MAGVTAVGRDATFDDSLCWVWWPDKLSELGYAAECVDGKTGLKINYPDSLHETDAAAPGISECCTFSLFGLNMEILRRSGACNIPAGRGDLKLSLSDIRRLKCRVSSQHELAKSDFFRHRVFGQWSRRDCQ